MTGPTSRHPDRGNARRPHAVIQGAFVLATAGGDGRLARESLDHLDRDLRLPFGAPAAPA